MQHIEIVEKTTKVLPTDKLIPYANNARTHTKEQIAQIAASIKEFGFNNPILLDRDNGIIAGHGRLLAAQQLGLETVPVLELSHLSETQKKAYILADNQIANNASWDMDLLKIEMENLDKNANNIDLSVIGFDNSMLATFLGKNVDNENDNHLTGKGSLAERFGVPPFSVLNAREGWWQDRKRAWLALGIKSEIGRSDELLNFSSLTATFGNRGGTEVNSSVFDPVLCELAYRWFCPVGGLVLDPFAGGSVRGIVAATLGREYIGYDLRQEQVEENQNQADQICNNMVPKWIVEDSLNMSVDIQADMVFTCPPYANLEVYSDDKRDLSTMPYEKFSAAYAKIIKKSCDQLKKDRFAVFVVGEVRAKNGAYYNFVGDTIQAFLDAGMCYYNEMILVTAVGSLPVRAGRQFKAQRKIGKTHQNVLVFVKGDSKAATEKCGEVEFGALETITTQTGNAGFSFG